MEWRIVVDREKQSIRVSLASAEEARSGVEKTEREWEAWSRCSCCQVICSCSMWRQQRPSDTHRNIPTIDILIWRLYMYVACVTNAVLQPNVTSAYCPVDYPIHVCSRQSQNIVPYFKTPTSGRQLCSASAIDMSHKERRSCFSCGCSSGLELSTAASPGCFINRLVPATTADNLKLSRSHIMKQFTQHITVTLYSGRAAAMRQCRLNHSFK